MGLGGGRLVRPHVITHKIRIALCTSDGCWHFDQFVQVPVLTGVFDNTHNAPAFVARGCVVQIPACGATPLVYFDF